MPNYAIVENDIVQNIVIAESIEDLSHLSDKEIIEVDSTVGILHFRQDGKFYPPKPNDTYVWYDRTREWVSPDEYEKIQSGEIVKYTQEEIREILIGAGIDIDAL
jgi:hypothetical protein